MYQYVGDLEDVYIYNIILNREFGLLNLMNAPEH